MTAVGVDGWRSRWVAAASDGRRITWRTHDGFADVLATYPDATVAVDMPIGVTAGRRAGDEAARGFLRERGGSPSSIFLTPDTDAVAAWEAGRSHAEAMAQRPVGRRVSIQAWNLIPAMIDVRDALAGTGRPDVHEAHPECSFRLLDTSIGSASKKTGRGVGLRLRALHTVLDLDLAQAPPDVPVDDLLDAAVLAWTAGRIASGAAIALPLYATGRPRILV